MKSRSQLHTILPPNPVVAELGVATCDWAGDNVKNWKPSRYYLVDIFGQLDQRGDASNPTMWHNQNYANAIKLASEFKEVTILKGLTWEMAVHVPDGSLDLLYLDACHWPECVSKDLAAWVPKVKKGGYIAGHDWGDTGYGFQHLIHAFCHGKYSINVIPENGPDASFYFQYA